MLTYFIKSVTYTIFYSLIMNPNLELHAVVMSMEKKKWVSIVLVYSFMLKTKHKSDLL